jgi:hypothetical protein
MMRYEVWINGKLVGKHLSVKACQEAVLAAGQVAEVPSVLIYEIRRNGEVIGEGELFVDPPDNAH